MNTVCEVCGDIGYRQLLLYCVDCKRCAVHQYCLDKVFFDASLIEWFCYECLQRRDEVTSISSLEKVSSERLLSHAHSRSPVHQLITKSLGSVRDAGPWINRKNKPFAIKYTSLNRGRTKQAARRGGVNVGMNLRELARQEALLEMAGRIIREDACPRTPEDLTMFDGGNHVNVDEEIMVRRPQDSGTRKRINYQNQFKSVQAQRQIFPYLVHRDTSVDYRFWNTFHSDFYVSVLFNAKNPRIVQMKYVDWEYMKGKQDKVCNQVIALCKRLNMYDLMGFQYDWNTEILFQFLSTCHFESSPATLHWMIEGRHYKVDFVTFARLLGLGANDRDAFNLHDERTLTNRDIASLYERASAADGMVSGLKSKYYTLNNLFRQTLNPKIGSASNLFGYARNILVRMNVDATPFSLSYFIWNEIKIASDDARKALPYAPYLMFIIERVTGLIFNKNVTHEAYRVEKTHHSGVGERSTRQRDSAAAADCPESSPSTSQRKKKKKKRKISFWLRRIFEICNYTATTAYQTRMELRQLQGFHQLEPPTPPPEYSEVSSFDSDDDIPWDKID